MRKSVSDLPTSDGPDRPGADGQVEAPSLGRRSEPHPGRPGRGRPGRAGLVLVRRRRRRGGDFKDSTIPPEPRRARRGDARRPRLHGHGRRRRPDPRRRAAGDHAAQGRAEGAGVRGARRARPWRDGGGLPGAADAAQSQVRPEDDPRGRARRARGGRAVPGRGRGGRAAEPPERHPDPRDRRARGVRRTSSSSTPRPATSSGGSTASPGRRATPRSWSRRWLAAWPRPTGWGSSTAT